jgi:hypothetical protein
MSMWDHALKRVGAHASYLILLKTNNELLSIARCDPLAQEPLWLKPHSIAIQHPLLLSSILVSILCCEYEYELKSFDLPEGKIR